MPLCIPIAGCAYRLTRVGIVCLVAWYVCLITFIPIAQQWDVSFFSSAETASEVERCVGMACSTNTDEPCCCMPAVDEDDTPELVRSAVISNCSDGESVSFGGVRSPWNESLVSARGFSVYWVKVVPAGDVFLKARRGVSRAIDKIPILSGCLSVII